MPLDFKSKLLCKLSKREFKDILFAFKNLIFIEFLELVTKSLCPASLSLGFLRRNYLHQQLEVGGDNSYRVKEKHHCNTAIKHRWRL